MFERVSGIWYLVSGIARRLFRRCLDTRYYILDTILLLSPFPALAQQELENPVKGANNVVELIGLMSAVFPTAIGSAALLFIIIGGFFFLTAAGNEEKIEKGKQTLAWVGVGVAVIFLAYLVIKFVIGTMVGAI